VALYKIAVRLLKRAKARGTGYGLKVALKLQRYLIGKYEEEQMKGVRFDKPRDYVCKADRKLPDDEQTVFKVRFLTAQEQADLRDEMYKVTGFGEGRKEMLLTGTVALKALEKCLLGWENFYFEDDEEPVEFNKKNISCIPPTERDEIANYVRGVQEEEA
jgi:hypothetical protein